MIIQQYKKQTKIKKIKPDINKIVTGKNKSEEQKSAIKKY